MLLRKEGFNYDLLKNIYTLRQRESDSYFDTANLLMEIFHKIYYDHYKKNIYFISAEVKFSREIDPLYCLILRYSLHNHQKLIIELPLITNNMFLINGSYYIPIFQMLDKPLVHKKKKNQILLHTNLGAFFTKAAAEKTMYIEFSSTTFKPFILSWFLGSLGVKKFCEITGLQIKNEDKNIDIETFLSDKNIKAILDISTLKNEYKTETFQTLLKQFDFIRNELLKLRKENKLTLKYINFQDDKFWSDFLLEYIGTKNFQKLIYHQKYIPILDIFSSHFMKYKDNIVLEFLRGFSTENEVSDLKNIKNKRIRCSEVIFINLLKQLYNFTLSTVYTKNTLSFKEKRLRIYDNLVMQLLSYISERNNSIMKLTELTKITQVGEGGYTIDMFVGENRDIHFSQYGTICPITTPDRERCGVVLYLSLSEKSRFNEMYYWPKKDEFLEYRLPLKTLEDYNRDFKTEKNESIIFDEEDILSQTVELPKEEISE